MVTKLTNGRIISGGKVIGGEDLYFDENGIIAIGGGGAYDAAADAAGGYVSAGFIDMHVHGGGGMTLWTAVRNRSSARRRFI